MTTNGVQSRRACRNGAEGRRTLSVWLPMAHAIQWVRRHAAGSCVCKQPRQPYKVAWDLGRTRLCGQEGPVAQRLEQGTHNPLVGGSNPSGPTIESRIYDKTSSLGSIWRYLWGYFGAMSVCEQFFHAADIISQGHRGLGEGLSTKVVDSDRRGAAGSNQVVAIGVSGSGRRWRGVCELGASWTRPGRVAYCVSRATADA